jgi:hypothetical protein
MSHRAATIKEITRLDLAHNVTREVYGKNLSPVEIEQEIIKIAERDCSDFDFNRMSLGQRVIKKMALDIHRNLKS